MVARKTRQHGRPSDVLLDTSKMREQLKQFGAMALSAQECANRLGVSRKEIFNFFHNMPDACDIYRAELPAAYLGQDARKVSAERDHNQIRVDAAEETECPICGGVSSQSTDTLTIDAASLVGSRSKLEKLLNRFLAERGDALIGEGPE